jgi:two-component system LytT family sensor kinase
MTRRLWLTIAAVWTILALLSASQHLAFRAYAGMPLPYGAIIGRTLLDWYTCAIFTPAIFAVARHFRLDTRAWIKALPVHILACIAFILLKLALFIPLARAFGWGDDEGDFLRWVYGDGFALILVYATVAGAWYALNYYESYRERLVKTAELESRLSRVQLDSLRARLHPHFLFNSLNALSTLIHKDARAADRMVLELGELLRQTISDNAPVEVPLRVEIGFVERYLNVMQIRFGERLRVTIDMPADVQEAQVPNLLMQPLVENAIVHGIGQSANAGEITVRARRDGEVLHLTVMDDGPGLSSGNSNHGIGLRNTRLLLQQLYRTQQSLQLTERAGGGVVASVQLPFHETPWVQS